MFRCARGMELGRMARAAWKGMGPMGRMGPTGATRCVDRWECSGLWCGLLACARQAFQGITIRLVPLDHAIYEISGVVFTALSLAWCVIAQPSARAELKAPGESSRKQIPNAAEFRKLLTRAQWSWEHKAPFTPHPIVFRNDGTVEQFHGWTAKWTITGEHEVTVTFNGKQAVLQFDREIANFRGTDFDGHRSIWGKAIEKKNESA
jgi:hypothetical protein